ncbi:glycosyltransferase family 4 protein [Caulobacter endophyticus]|uniref:glycosyltransferase family 4 protein n=1 Tax=Caulobacter endophyticus TaxID=2172652 RepID=UPI00240FDAD1|nr:glycosyltransferase [Caulobacter endophyticus]MDG2527285.1 glycosyltransferase [Caulobacter endophyticus]
MSLALKLHKSAGVPVTAGVHRLLVKANGARDAKQWTQAARGYAEALSLAPDLAHIHTQHGHALKELGDLPAARAAYLRAMALRPDTAEPHLHLGHLHKMEGDIAAAARSYLSAARIDPAHPDALLELSDLAAQGSDVKSADLMSLLRLRELGTRSNDAHDWLALPSEAEHADASGQAEDGAPSGPALVFDVSDLISYFRNARLPTGIQRVQIETIASALRSASRRVQVCVFAEQRDEWVEIAPGVFLDLCRLSLASGDRQAPDWTTAMTRMRLMMNLADPIAFPQGAFLINLGTSWWLQNYFLFVRQAKALYGIRYVPFVHDLIPIVAGEHCTKALTQDFISWAIGAVDHADFFLVNSEATRRDLLAMVQTLGQTVDPDTIAIVHLDADFRKADTPPAPEAALADWGLHREPFVLFVSTIESRKNHLGAFEAWIALIGRHGMRKVPKLVCVGNRGWLNDAIYARLDTHEGLRERVVMLSGLSDAQLARLYASCLFTLYPSSYEGWGLPVTESLCYGKVPLTSDASSLPEAGGPFAVRFEAGNTPQLIDTLETLMFDAGFRADCERKIAEAFRPRAWSEIAEQMADQIDQWSRRESPPRLNVPAQLGFYHPITRNFATRIWRGMRSAEAFRAGGGWWPPDDWGCWSKPRGGRLEIALPPTSEPLRFYLRLHGLPTRSTTYEVRVSGASRVMSGALASGEFKWLACDVAPSPEQVLHVTLKGGETENLANVTSGQDARVVSVGLSGFFLCAANDTNARASFLEAVMLNQMDDLSFGRELSEQSHGLGERSQ